MKYFFVSFVFFVLCACSDIDFSSSAHAEAPMYLPSQSTLNALTSLTASRAFNPSSPSNNQATTHFYLAQTAWHARNISRYKIHIYRDTFESPTPISFNNSTHTTVPIDSHNSLVLVDNQEVLESYQLSDDNFLGYERQTLNVQAAMTVEELFMMIENALDNNALIGEVNYHPYGYPLDFQYLDNDGHLVSLHTENFDAPTVLTANQPAHKSLWLEL
jgi:hypothetical protein